MDSLSFIDLFKTQFFFYYQGRTKKSTNLGVLLSVCIFIFLIYQFTISEFIVKQSPIVLNQSLASFHAQKIEFNEKKPFIVAFGNATTLERFMDPTVLQIVVAANINGVSSFMPVHPCKYEELKYSMNESYFNLLHFDKAYCLEQKTFDIEGYIDESQMKFMQIFVFPCNNLTANGTCQPLYKIHQIIKSLIFTFMFQSVEIDANDFQNPLKEKILPTIITLNPLLKKSTILALKNSQVTTDDGWIFAGISVKKVDGIMIDGYQQEFDLISDNDPFAYFNIIASKQYVLCSRNYQKLPETLASLAGMANLFMIIGSILCSLISYVSSMRYILNKLYYFENYSDKDKKKDENNRKSPENNFEILKSPEHMNSKKIRETIFKKSKFSQIPKSNSKVEVTQKEETGKINENNEICNNNAKIEMTVIQKNTEENISFHHRKKELEEDSFILEKYSNDLDEDEKQNNTKPLKFEKIETQNNEKINRENNIKISLQEHPEPKNNPTSIKNLSDTKTIQKHEIESANRFESLISEGNFQKQIDKLDPLNLNVFEYLKFLGKKAFCLKKTKKEQLIYEAEKTFKKELDISQILIKLHEIENLKLLLLDSDQMVLFNYLTKPRISIQENKKEGIVLRVSKNEENPTEFYDSYLKCCEVGKTNIISNKLVTFCDLRKAHFSKTHH